MVGAQAGGQEHGLADRPGGIDAADGVEDRLAHRSGGPLRAQQQGKRRTGILFPWHENLGNVLAGSTVLLERRDDADHDRAAERCVARSRRWEHVEYHPEGIALGKEHLYEALVDDRHARRAPMVLRPEAATAQQRHTQDIEVARSHPAVLRAERVLVLQRASLDEDAAPVAAARAARRGAGEGHLQHLGPSGERLTNP